MGTMTGAPAAPAGSSRLPESLASLQDREDQVVARLGVGQGRGGVERCGVTGKDYLGPWASRTTSLYSSFPIYKIGRMMPTS